MFCMNCGKQNPDTAKFCYNCGTALSRGPVHQTPPVYQTQPVYQSQPVNQAAQPRKTAPAKKKKGWFKRFFVSMLVFAIFYAGAYHITTWKANKPATKPASSASSDTAGTIQIHAETDFKVNVYADHWNDVRIWAWSNEKGDLFDVWPGASMNTDGNGWYSYELPKWVDHVLVSGNGGTVQTADIPVDPQESWILVYSDNAASITYLNPAKEENAWTNTEILGPVGAGDPEPVVPVLPQQPQQPDTGYIADLGGSWEQVQLMDGNFSLNVSALRFSETVYNCTGLTVNMDVTMNAGTSCKDWQVWGRSGNTFVKLAKIYLPAGNGYVSQSITFPSPVTFDAIAVTPTIVGGYSWSMSLGITDVYTN